VGLQVSNARTAFKRLRCSGTAIVVDLQEGDEFVDDLQHPRDLAVQEVTFVVLQHFSARTPWVIQPIIVTRRVR
jgi:hypothetical protein